MARWSSFITGHAFVRKSRSRFFLISFSRPGTRLGFPPQLAVLLNGTRFLPNDAPSPVLRRPRPPPKRAPDPPFFSPTETLFSMSKPSPPPREDGKPRYENLYPFYHFITLLLTLPPQDSAPKSGLALPVRTHRWAKIWTQKWAASFPPPSHPCRSSPHT